jgi:hypothetical protein
MPKRNLSIKLRNANQSGLPKRFDRLVEGSKKWHGRPARETTRKMRVPHPPQRFATREVRAPRDLKP